MRNGAPVCLSFGSSHSATRIERTLPAFPRTCPASGGAMIGEFIVAVICAVRASSARNDGITSMAQVPPSVRRQSGPRIPLGSPFERSDDSLFGLFS